MRSALTKLLPKAYGIYFNFLSLFSKRKAAEKAFRLFATVRKGRVSPHQREYLDAAKKEVLQIADHNVQTYTWPGNGDTVLLVHGWESNTFRWRNLIAKLKERDYNIVAFDAPAHGHSSGQRLHVPLYATCLQHIIDTYSPSHLIGHSIGGMTLLYNHHLHPDPNIEKIVTIGSPSEFEEILGHFQQLLDFNQRVLNALQGYVFERFGFKSHEFSSSRFVADNSVKGLLLHDKKDRLAPFHASERVHAHWEGSEFVRTEGLGHSMHQDHINEKIIAFLDS
ncbi:MAG: alpha/beta hydrolase [Pricia sp.]